MAQCKKTVQKRVELVLKLVRPKTAEIMCGVPFNNLDR